MSGSQSKRNHRREARTRAEAPKSFMHALLPKRVGRAFALLTRTYHGCRLHGSNGAVGFTGITSVWPGLAPNPQGHKWTFWRLEDCRSSLRTTPHHVYVHR